MQVEELGTMIEALQPVPGLDPDAFFAVLRGQGAGVREKGLDYRDVKIVQMAKRSRVLSARLDGEKTRWELPEGQVNWYFLGIRGVK